MSYYRTSEIYKTVHRGQGWRQWRIIWHKNSRALSPFVCVYVSVCMSVSPVCLGRVCVIPACHTHINPYPQMLHIFKVYVFIILRYICSCKTITTIKIIITLKSFLVPFTILSSATSYSYFIQRFQLYKPLIFFMPLSISSQVLDIYLN